MITNPLLVSPDPRQLQLSRQGQPMAAVIDGRVDGNATGSPISAGVVRMPPGHSSAPHQHNDSWIVVLVWTASSLGAITLYGPGLARRIHQAVGQVLVIPPGVPHAAINPSQTDDLVAYEFRSSTSIDTDNIVLDELRHCLDEQRPTLFDMQELAPR